jgi:hypothetical protein
MRQRVFILTFGICLTLILFSCGQTENKPKEQTQNLNPMPRAEQIKISDLKSVLTRLQNKQLEFDFFGITSNGIDCIYFVPDNNLYAIEFEIMTEDQKPWLDKLKVFAQQNNYKTVMTTYNNQPHYKSSEPAPVLRIEIKSNLDQTAIIGHNIMTQIFGNNVQTTYDVVP